MRPLPALLVLLIIANPTYAAEIHLKDGSVIIGSVLTLVDGEDLVIDTEYMDEVTIEWNGVEEIRGTKVIEVELFDGRRVFGQIEVSEADLRIIGDDTLIVPQESVFAIDEVNESFWDGLGLYTDLGMNVVRGNNQVTQVSFGAGVSYDARNYEMSLDATTIINEQTDATDTRRATLGANYSYKFGKNWIASGLLQFESDEQQGLEGRTLFGGAIGNRVVNQRRHRVDVNVGLVVNIEDFELTPATESLEALLGASYRLRSKVDIDTSLYLFPNLEQSDRFRAQFDASLSVDLISDLDFKVTAYNRYDSEPPFGNEKNDAGVTVGLSWSK